MPNNKCVLITGATRGIGEAIAAKFSVLGYHCVITGTSSAQIEKLNNTNTTNKSYLAVDFNEQQSLESFLDNLNNLPRLDACINCAGINIIKKIDEVTAEDLARILLVNYSAAYQICKVASSKMQHVGGGHILNIASIWSVISKPKRSLYSGTKAALVGLTRALAAELGEYNILVNSLSPGFVLTDLTRASLSENELDELAKQVPLQRFAQPEEIATLAAYLAGPDNTYLTGQNVVIDGGFSIV